MAENQFATLHFPENSEVGVRVRYIARLNPKGVNRLAYKFGYPAIKNHVEARVAFLNKFLKEEGEDDYDKAFIELVKIHPDRNIIADSLNEDMFESDDYDSVIGEAIGAVAGLGTSVVNKLGAGKDRKANLAMSGKENIAKMIQQKEKVAAEEAKTKRVIIISSVVGAVVLIAVTVFVIIYLKKNK